MPCFSACIPINHLSVVIKLPEFLAIKPWCLIASHTVACVGPSSFMWMNEEREDMADGGDRARTSQLAAGVTSRSFAKAQDQCLPEQLKQKL